MLCRGIRSLLTFSALQLLHHVTIVASKGPQFLQRNNFDKLVYAKGKQAFVKFFVPWCGYCQELKPDWDELGEHYEDSPNVVIGEVDCSIDKPLCEEHGVKEYPYIKVFKTNGPKMGERYQDLIDKWSLKDYVKDTLKGKRNTCDVMTKKGCLPHEKKILAEFDGKSASEVKQEVESLKERRTLLKLLAKKLQRIEDETPPPDPNDDTGLSQEEADNIGVDLGQEEL